MARLRTDWRIIPGLLLVSASFLAGSVRGYAQTPSIRLKAPVSNDENPLRTVFVDRDVDASGGLSEAEYVAQSMR